MTSPTPQTRIRDARNRLFSALDRQYRADTTTAWLADQSAYDKAMAELVELGRDPIAEGDRAAKAVEQADRRESAF